ncbi:MAG: acyloxyacyl hydrolase [Bacteroidota bacterium]|nr:acyloxyacyl hydrolase [Bacteroidota bacterium]
MYRQLTVSVILLLFAIGAFAQQNNSSDSIEDKSKIFSIGLRGQYSYLWLHSQDIAPIGQAYPWGLQAEFNWHLVGEKTWQQCNCYPRTGLIVSWFNFDNPKVLGHGFSGVYYIEPFFTFDKKVNISLRGAAGFSYLTRPYDSLTNPLNYSYSMPLGGFLMIHLALNYRLNKRTNVSFSANINHVSNGGIREPNKGINFPSASIGVDYSLQDARFKKRERSRFIPKAGHKYHKEFIAFVSSKVIMHGEKKRHLIYGMGFSFSREVGKLNALNAGAEWKQDFALKEKLRREGVTGMSNYRAGILLGHEFLMGRFSLSQQIGIYIYDPSHYNDMVYQRYGLNYRLGKLLLIGINVKAHRQVADFLDFRAGIGF